MNDRILATVFLASLAGSALAQQSATSPSQSLPDTPEPTAAALTQPNGPTVVLDTSMGRITCQFFQRQAPRAVANFIGLANGTKDWTDPKTHQKVHGKRFYDHTTFHRVIPGFMIQGGDPSGTGTGDAGYSFGNEVVPGLDFDQPGRLALANTGQPNSNGSQFFITEDAYPSLNGHYTIFGQCNDLSLYIVRAIAHVQTNRQDKPLTPVYLDKVTIVPEGQPLPPRPDSASAPAKP
jgi:peptidyl-prolyl cis-trans isomerase A (cyclophilin A)